MNKDSKKLVLYCILGLAVTLVVILLIVGVRTGSLTVRANDVSDTVSTVPLIVAMVLALLVLAAIAVIRALKPKQ